MAGITINELDEITEVPSDSYLVVDNGTKTNKVSRKNLMKNITSVSNFPKLATDIDDTERLQRALDYCYQNNLYLHLNPETYYVRSLTMQAGMTLNGNGAILKKPNLSIEPYNYTVEQMKWLMMLSVQYGDNLDSKMTTIKDLNFDGSCWDMWSIDDGYAQEQASMLFIGGLINQPEYSGRLNITIENCSFKDNVSDGIHIYTNSNVNISNCRSKDCFRGGLTITGGNCDINVNNWIFKSEYLSDGIDIEIDSAGYNGSYACNINFNNIIIDNDLDVDASQDSIINLNNVTLKNGVAVITAQNNSTINIVNSNLKRVTSYLVGSNIKLNIMNSTIEGIDSSQDYAIQFIGIIGNNPSGLINIDSCLFKNCYWALSAPVLEATDINVRGCTFDSSCIRGAIGGIINGTAFAPRYLNVSNCNFYNPSYIIHCQTIYEPTTIITLEGNNIYSAENFGFYFHDITAIFKNEFYNICVPITYSNGANAKYIGKRTMIIDDESVISNLASISRTGSTLSAEDILILRDRSKKWKYTNSSWVEITEE